MLVAEIFAKVNIPSFVFLFYSSLVYKQTKKRRTKFEKGSDFKI
jgi:hypothetical protein